MHRQTKIGATIGPSCQDPNILKELVQAGLNFARLNFSHGTYETHESAIKNIRALEKATGHPIAILQDLSGPKIRVGIVPNEGVAIKDGQMVTFSTVNPTYSEDVIPVDAPNLEDQLKVSEHMLIDDGRMEVKIIKINPGTIFTEVIDGGAIMSHKGLNFPNSTLHVSAMREKDKADLRFGLTMEVDMVALSFVKDAQDILDARWLMQKYLDESGKPLIPLPSIIAKIERHEAVSNLDEILAAADGIMVARGDLGLELPKEDVPLIQKKIIDAANAAAKPVIVATQLLDSMQHSRRPTRAEISDVANAVIDHADALLLTNETAVGEYPVLSVQTMAEVIVSTEKSHYDDTKLPTTHHKKIIATEVAVTELSRILAEEVHAKLILAASLTGETGRLISHVRPELPIVVATETQRVSRQLNLSWGVQPFILLPCSSIEELVDRSTIYVKQHKLAKSGDKIIVVAGEPVGQAGNVNLVEVREIK